MKLIKLESSIEEIYESRLKERYNSLRRHKPGFGFTDAEIGFFRLCNHVSDQGYENIATRYVEKYLRARDVQVRDLIYHLGDHHQDRRGA